MAVLGAALGLASLIGDWAEVELIDGTTASVATIFSESLCGITYTLALAAMLTMVAVVVFGPPRQRSRSLRTAGFVLTGISLVVLAAIAYLVDIYPYRVKGYSFDLRLTMGWGLFAAFGAWCALGIALLHYSPAVRRPPGTSTEGAAAE